MRSAGLFFLQSEGAVKDDDLDKYALNPSTAASRVDVAADDPDNSTLKPPSIPSKRSASSLKAWSSQTASSWKWALFTRNKFEEIILKFRKWNLKLKELVPIALGVNSRFRTLSSESLVALVDNQDARRIGLRKPVKLRQLVVDPTFETRSLRLENARVEAPEECSALTIGYLTRDGIKERSLIEYKYKVPTQTLNNSRNLGWNDQSNVSSLMLEDEEDDRQVHQLASLLSSSGSGDLHTLPFEGYIQQENQGRSAFCFKFPSESDQSDPKSLYSIIDHASSSDRFSLPIRFKVAQIVAKTIGAFHAVGWVHKSIRSHSIVFFRDRDNPAGPPTYESPYLVDFEYSRPEDAGTLLLRYDNDIEKDLYRHPDRQGLPKSSFTRSHDLYSLGVVLLEIGVWQTAMKIYKEACDKMKKGVPSPRGIRNIFIDIAKRRLPHHMGPAYLDAVVYCLQCEPPKSKTVDDNFSMDFLENVVRRLDMKRLLIDDVHR